ncbi:uncharacterized protein GIQ15_04983 [Arthroderma uncinatum]|uniref:uncharacterized protein n=1 Tax=Arthroderma uncinatum TaxID=74035 RepID=UPI00144A9B7A|nr:uncharacterized protein GIQ15_04983 [Arthroderma uncinatum]KAF3482224.1 hypothetical protein GIQ15_04983 [Arthroderma uncinatum]
MSHHHQHHHRRRQRLTPSNAAASSSAASLTPSTAPPSSLASGSRQFRGVKSMRDLIEAPAITAFRARFEAGRSFDLDDDLEFCPNLLTEDDLHSIHSLAASDRSSLGSASPDSSPLQHQVHPTSGLVQQHMNMNNMHNMNNMAMMGKIHQPAAVRTRNAIPIVNPSTGMRVSSPPRW